MSGFYKAVLFFSLISTQIVQAQWVTQSVGFTGPKSIQNISAPDANTAWLSSNEGFPFVLTRDFARTVNGGTNWNTGVVGSDNNLYINGIYACDALNAWACMANLADTGGYIYHTTNGGQNWVRQDSAIFHNKPVFVHFWNADTGICIGNPYQNYFEIFTTIDGGADWEALPQTQMPGALDEHFLSPSSVFIFDDQIWFGGYTQGRIYYSDNRGQDWSIIPFPEDVVSYVAFRDTIGFGAFLDPANNNSQLYKSLDKGQSWTKLNATNLMNPFRMAYISGTPGTLISSGLNNLMISNNWGENWDLMQGPSTNPSSLYPAVAFIDNTHGWLGGQVNSSSQGGVYKYTGPALTVPGLDSDNVSFRIFPNPASGSMTIELNTERSLPVTAQLLEISGKIAGSWSFTSGIETLHYPVNLDGIQSGIYILKLSIGDVISFNKLIVK
jgi:photosystem II stability/assembly factor-like uncharacterized protein